MSDEGPGVILTEKKKLPYRVYGFIHYCDWCGSVMFETIDKTKPTAAINYTCPCRGWEMLRVIIDSDAIKTLRGK